MSRPSDAGIGETFLLHVLRSVDISEVDNNWTCHESFHAVEIKGAKLLPFGDNHSRVGVFKALIGTGRVGHVGKHSLCLFHPYRVVGSDLGAHVLQGHNHRNRWSLAHIVSIWLDVRPNTATVLPRRTPEKTADTLRAIARFRVSFTTATASTIRSGTS